MSHNKIPFYAVVLLMAALMTACKTPAPTVADRPTGLPQSYDGSRDSISSANLQWRQFFKDRYLNDLITTALANNQELQVTLQEIEIARNDIRIRKGALLPTAGIRAGAGLEKVGRYTSQGAGDASTEIMPGKEVPDPLADFTIAAYANWEVDIWKKLRNSKKAAVNRYLATVEGKNFVLTNLIAEVAGSYYELLALDNQLDIVRQNIAVQQHALEVVSIQKQAARATELGVQKFNAEVLKSQSLEFEISQRITETENRLNFLLGRFPQPIARDKAALISDEPAAVMTGIPSQLLANRPDIRQAELELAAAKLDVKAARAEFYPSFGISAAVGFQAFNPSYLLRTPESLLYNLAGELIAPLVNRNAIKAEFRNANARQIQAMVEYQRTILNAYAEVSTQLSKISNLHKSYEFQAAQVESLNRSSGIANDLFASARVDYFEVLMTQRDALESKLDLMETRKDQWAAAISMYRDLGGGWQ